MGRKGFTPLILAAKFGSLATVEMFMQAGSKRDYFYPFQGRFISYFYGDTRHRAKVFFERIQESSLVKLEDFDIFHLSGALPFKIYENMRKILEIDGNDLYFSL